jgi:hypothetical protein
MAFGFSSKPLVKAKGVPSSVTGIGEEPVVSIQVPFIVFGST